MAKKTQIDRAIEKLDADIAVLQAARERLVHERLTVVKPKRARKPVIGAEPLGVRILNA